MEIYPVNQGTEMLEAPQATHQQTSKIDQLNKNTSKPTVLDPVEKQQPHE